MRKGQRLWTLFSSMLYISAFTFGGGFVIVSLMQKKFVDQLHWLEEEEMLDMTALAQASPGAIAVNAAILVGRKVAGGAGMAVAVLGTILPPMVVLSVISLAYQAFASNPWVAGHAGGCGGSDCGCKLAPGQPRGQGTRSVGHGADDCGFHPFLCVPCECDLSDSWRGAAGRGESAVDG